MEWTNTRKVLEQYGAKVVNRWLDNLRRSNKIASGTLANSLDYVIDDEGERLVITFRAEKYAIWVDQGRRPGKMPPLDKIQQWCGIRGIDKKYAFPIARNIGIRGIKPTNFLNIPQQSKDKFEKDLEAAYVLDIEDEINKDL